MNDELPGLEAYPRMQPTARFDLPDRSSTDRVVDLIQSGHPAGLEQLYVMARNYTFFLIRQLGRDDVQDRVHDIFLTAAEAIKSGKLRDSKRLFPFLTTVTRFYTYGQLDRRSVRRKYTAELSHDNIADSGLNPEQALYRKQRS